MLMPLILRNFMITQVYLQTNIDAGLRKSFSLKKTVSC